MTTIQSIDQYKDILFYLFLAGIIHIIWTAHQYKRKQIIKNEKH